MITIRFVKVETFSRSQGNLCFFKWNYMFSFSQVCSLVRNKIFNLNMIVFQSHLRSFTAIQNLPSLNVRKLFFTFYIRNDDLERKTQLYSLQCFRSNLLAGISYIIFHIIRVVGFFPIHLIFFKIKSRGIKSGNLDRKCSLLPVPTQRSGN